MIHTNYRWFKPCRLAFCLNLVSLLALLFCLGSECHGQDSELRDIVLERPDEILRSFKGSYALVIGNSEYRGWPRLPGVADDVRSVSDVLRRNGFVVTVVENVSREEMERAISRFIDSVGTDAASYDNRLLIYFAGHGYTQIPRYGGEAMGFLVGIDAPSSSHDPGACMARSIDMGAIWNYAVRIQSRHALFMFDACFSGSIFGINRGASNNITYKARQPVRQFITSGSADEEVPDDSEFRRAFERALDGKGDGNRDGYITGSELSTYIEEQVTQRYPEQHPQYGKISQRPALREGDFIFAHPDAGGAVYHSSIASADGPGGTDPVRLSLRSSSGAVLHAGDRIPVDEKVAIVAAVDSTASDVVAGRYLYLTLVEENAEGRDGKRTLLWYPSSESQSISNFVGERVVADLSVSGSTSHATTTLIATREYIPPDNFFDWLTDALLTNSLERKPREFNELRVQRFSSMRGVWTLTSDEKPASQRFSRPELEKLIAYHENELGKLRQELNALPPDSGTLRNGAESASLLLRKVETMSYAPPTYVGDSARVYEGEEYRLALKFGSETPENARRFAYVFTIDQTWSAMRLIPLPGSGPTSHAVRVTDVEFDDLHITMAPPYGNDYFFAILSEVPLPLNELDTIAPQFLARLLTGPTDGVAINQALDGDGETIEMSAPLRSALRRSIIERIHVITAPSD
jgi:hypothetical protein